MNTKMLNSRFAAKGNLFFSEGKGGLVIVKISNKYADCDISLYGAHILKYEPCGETDLLWMSEKSYYEVGKAIRGGIPLCFPWFGPSVSNPALPQHGFARIINWEVEHVNTLEDSSTQIVLACISDEFTKKLWAFEFSAKLIITVGSRLTVDFQVKNTGKLEFTYTNALHSYFRVSQISGVALSGLHGSTYFDGINGQELITQSVDKLHFVKEENRRYIGHSCECVIEDKGLERKIHVAKQGSNSTVVWNPWAENCKKMEDVHPDGYKTMLCVEAANALTDAVTLKAGETHSLLTEIWSEKI